MRAGGPKPPPPPLGDQLVSWSQLYRYLDNPFDVMLFTLAVLGCLGSGAAPRRRRSARWSRTGARAGSSAPGSERAGRPGALRRLHASTRIMAQARSDGRGPENSPWEACGAPSAPRACAPPCADRPAQNRSPAAHIHGHLWCEATPPRVPCGPVGSGRGEAPSQNSGLCWARSPNAQRLRLTLSACALRPLHGGPFCVTWLA